MTEPTSILAGRRVLVADDEAFSLSIVTRMVRDLGCDTFLQANNGVVALRQLQENADALSLLILDFNMPEVNGLQVLKAVRTGRAAVERDTQIVMLTGSSDFGLVGAAMALDVDAFVIKPVSKATLAQRLDKVFNEAREIKSAAAYDAVDIESVSRRLLSNKPVGTPRPKSEIVKPTSSPGMRVKLESVQAGAILADNIRSPAGELLLGKATVLTDRLLRRLKELQAAIGIEYVYVMSTPAPEKADA
jgi:CheY-like chemotaxis protein